MTIFGHFNLHFEEINRNHSSFTTIHEIFLREEKNIYLSAQNHPSALNHRHCLSVLAARHPVT